MPVLANPRHERFAQELSKGRPAYVAHKTAGFSGARGDASKLQRKPSIIQRVEEIIAGNAEVEKLATAKAIEAVAVDKQWVLERLVDNAQKEDGAVSNRALELIGKELGMFVKKIEQRVQHDLSGVSDDDLHALRDIVAKFEMPAASRH